MKALIVHDGFTCPKTGATPSIGDVVDAHTARHAFSAGYAVRWGPKQRKAYMARTSSVMGGIPDDILAEYQAEAKAAAEEAAAKRGGNA